MHPNSHNNIRRPKHGTGGLHRRITAFCLSLSCTLLMAAETPLKQLKESAGTGDAKAQHELATAYALGTGGLKKPDLKEAFFWYRKAADSGIGEAQFKMGYFYENGISTRTNKVEAEKWYRLAAMQGVAPAHLAVGIASAEAGDHIAAVKSFKFAAESGLPIAQRMLGEYYMTGQGGLSRDPVEALKWMLIAAEHSDPKAIERADSLRKNHVRNPELIAEAEKRAREFVPR
ncbi:MAG TPA: tetratricopeptide repeat protein [Roseimicrobium sp.]|nr:tetratricopeptide repeat protein [Roseimicrobium sp.]